VADTGLDADLRIRTLAHRPDNSPLIYGTVINGHLDIHTQKTPMPKFGGRPDERPHHRASSLVFALPKTAGTGRGVRRPITVTSIVRGRSPACPGAVPERRMGPPAIYTRSPSVLHACLLVCGGARAAGDRRVGVDAMRRVGMIVALTALLACPEGGDGLPGPRRERGDRCQFFPLGSRDHDWSLPSR
jgi:hypothetical protein